MSAAAVLIYFPSPRGLAGTSETGNVIFDTVNAFPPSAGEAIGLEDVDAMQRVLEM